MAQRPAQVPGHEAEGKAPEDEEGGIVGEIEAWREGAVMVQCAAGREGGYC